ncbi:MAG: ribosome small subunit-dependent GTPase A [Armatimonadetes bacterium]|nr:ribosome small subunit-dependent GTPase A [Armatimonadota bacterium]
MDLQEATVTKALGGFYFVHASGQVIRCVLRGRLKKAASGKAQGRLRSGAGQAGRQDEEPSAEERAGRGSALRQSQTPQGHLRHGARAKTTSPVVPGDRVRFRTVGSAEGVIEEILPRSTELVKASPRDPLVHQVLAANVDQAIVVAAVRDPEPHPHIIDRWLVLAEACGLQPVMCINKIDLADPAPLAGRYAGTGYPILPTSAATGEGLDALRGRMTGRISVLVGSSGVGKSSLLNALQPGLTLRVGDIAAKSRRGRHTTTTAELVPLDFGGYVVDTPGVQVLEMTHLDPVVLPGCFPEFEPLVPQCDYPDCRHLVEPGCAVRAAVEAGGLHPERYASYRAMAERVEPRKRTLVSPADRRA